MARKRLILVMLAVAAALPLASEARMRGTPQSTSVVLPDTEATFPAGSGVEAVNTHCLSCHSVEMVLNQPDLAKPAWTAIVTKMRNVYKAPVPEADIAAIVDYLAAIKGAK